MTETESSQNNFNFRVPPPLLEVNCRTKVIGDYNLHALTFYNKVRITTFFYILLFVCVECVGTIHTALALERMCGHI